MNDNYDHIREYVDSMASDDTRELVSDFAILWNMYEKVLFGREHHIKDIKFHILREISFDKNNSVIINKWYNELEEYLSKKEPIVLMDYESLVKYFHILIKKPVIVNGVIQKKDGKTQYSKGDIFERNMRRIIDSSDIESKLHLLLIIVARVRNNMFHGIKKVEKLDEQAELFIICNQILNFVLLQTGGYEKWNRMTN